MGGFVAVLHALGRPHSSPASIRPTMTKRPGEVPTCLGVLEVDRSERGIIHIPEPPRGGRHPLTAKGL